MKPFGAYITECYYDVWGMKNFFKKPNKLVSKRWINMTMLQVTTAAHQKISKMRKTKTREWKATCAISVKTFHQ